MKYMVPLWGVLLLALLACVSILLSVRSALDSLAATRREADAVRLIQRTDSLWKEWISRGCAPRTQALP